MPRSSKRTIPFTDAKIRSLSVSNPDALQEEWFDRDNPGFGIRINRGGRRAWFLYYRKNGKRRRIALGAYPGMRLAAARSKARIALGQVEDGADPAKERAASRDSWTVKELGEDFIDQYCKKRKLRTWKRYEKILERDVYPVIGSTKAREVTRSNIKDVLARIEKRNALVAANRCHEIVRKMFNYAVDEEVVETNPALRMVRHKESESDRTFTQDEIRALWEGFADDHTGDIFKLILVTGQRISEVAGMVFDEISEEDALWTVPAARMKNKKPHIVPLTRMALDIIRTARSRQDDEARARNVNNLLFPSPVKPEQSRSNLDKASKAVRKAAGVDDFASHHLRRTCGTRITSLGFSRFIMDRVLGHLEPGVGARYDRHDYLPEKSKALNIWAGCLNEILTGEQAPKNVVDLRSV